MPLAPTRSPKASTIVGVLALLVVAVAVWLRPAHSGDTMMVLAGGRDVIDGKLGEVDDWAFTTDRPWINQNWGTGVLFYAAHAALGFNGLVAVKALAVATLALFLLLALRSRGIGLAIAAGTTAATLYAARSFIDMRPNLVSLALMAMTMWCLLAARGQPRRIWVVLVPLTLWANMHGSFLFGLGMLGLWMVCCYGVLVLRGSPAQRRHALHLPACLVAATAVAILSSPYGLDNLIFPLTSLTGDGAVWRNVAEWQPIFGGTSNFADVRGFLILTGTALGASVAATVALRRDRRAADASRGAATGEGDLAAVVFETALATLTVGMAFTSRRFVPIALVALSLPLGRAFATLLADRRAAWPAAIGAVAAITLVAVTDLAAAWAGALAGAIAAASILAPASVARAEHRAGSGPIATTNGALLASALFALPGLYDHYRTDNPNLGPYETLFERMIYHDGFPVGAAAFLNANAIGGKVFNEWWWEGYLHWHCPQLQLFIGGRAQAAYRAELYPRWSELFRGNVPAEQAAAQGVPLFVAPMHRDGLLRQLFFADASPWVPIFCNGWEWVFANAREADGRAWIAAAEQGSLVYPDAAAGRISAFVRAAAPPPTTPPTELLAAARAANQIRPTEIAYAALAHRAAKQPAFQPVLLRYFEAEAERLASIDHDRARGLELLVSRRYVVDHLWRASVVANDLARVAKWAAQRDAVRATIATVHRRSGVAGGLPTATR